MTKTFAERCKMFEQCLPDASYRDLLTALHAEMLAKLAEQPAPAAQQAVAYGMWDTMLGKDNRMMMVRLDKGQDGCTVPLFPPPQAQPAPVKQKPVGYVCFEGDEVVWTGDPPESGTVLYTTPQASKVNT